MKDLNLIVKMKFGSHLYGTATEDSDTDYKGVFLPTAEEVLLNKVNKSYSFNTKTGKEERLKNTSGDTDTEIYSLHYFIKLALEGQTVAIDMLHAPESCLMYNTAIWNYMVSNREMFYTKNLSAFVGYARKQAAKYGIKGSRLNAAKEVLDGLEENMSNGDILTMGDIWDLLPIGEHLYFTSPDQHGNIFYQVCGKKLGKTVKVNYAYKVVLKFYEEYGKRAQMAAENKGIDWKAVSHAVRAAYQIIEIFKYKTITFPLKEADFLIKVKKGLLDYNTVVAPKLEELMEEVERLSIVSDLPEKADRGFWDDWLCFTLKDNLF